MVNSIVSILLNFHVVVSSVYRFHAMMFFFLFFLRYVEGPDAFATRI